MNLNVNSLLAKHLGEHVLGASVNYRAETLPSEILFLDESTQGHKDCIYIATSKAMEACENHHEPLSRCYLFIPKGRKPTRQQLALASDTSIFFTDLDAGSLYNALHRTLLQLSEIEPMKGSATASHNVPSEMMAPANAEARPTTSVKKYRPYRLNRVQVM